MFSLSTTTLTETDLAKLNGAYLVKAWERRSAVKKVEVSLEQNPKGLELVSNYFNKSCAESLNSVLREY